MLRKFTFALATIIAIGGAFTATEASAWDGRWHGGWHHGWHHVWRPHFGFYPHYGYGGCYQSRWIPGWGWRRVWVCG
jgi:hypothetical protein